MRILSRVGGAFAVGVAVPVALLTAPAAQAAAPGDNGTVKIHDATTGEELRKNEPHVCTFYLDAFGFDGGQQVGWRIEAWAPAADVKGREVASGSVTLGADGHGRTEDKSLPDGHYKLFWNFDGEHGSAKHKVFWTDCADDGKSDGKDGGSSDGPGSGEGGDEGVPADGPSASVSASPAAADGTNGSDGASVSSSPSAQGGDSGDLAETGSSAPVGVLSGAAAALLAGGGYLLLRRRKAGRG